MGTSIQLPREGGQLYAYEMRETTRFTLPEKPFHSRVAFSAAHVVCDPFSAADPLHDAQIDWEATLNYRHHLWSHGMAVAEAMDTAQRGMGLDWDRSKELIRRSLAEAGTVGGRIACGAGTDHLPPLPGVTLADVQAAYEEQVGFVEGEGGQVILMASRALAACAEGPEDYIRIYGEILRQVKQPVILHWLGDMFDPALAGYWGAQDDYDAMDICLQVIKENAGKVDGIKLSLLNADKEVRLRRVLPDNVKMYTGDDFNYPALIRGDRQGYSHALLGIFDAIAPAAATALHALDEEDTQRYESIMEPTVALSRHIFQKPTYAYKTGIVFMAYLNGHQRHFRMIAGAEGTRSVIHLAQLFVLADQAGLLIDPELAAERMRRTLSLAGVE